MAGFSPPDYESPLPVPSGSQTKVNGVAKGFAPPAVPPVPQTAVDGVLVDWEVPLAVPSGSQTEVNGVPKNFNPLPEPPAPGTEVDGVAVDWTPPLPDPSGGAWTLTNT